MEGRYGFRDNIIWDGCLPMLLQPRGIVRLDVRDNPYLELSQEVLQSLKERHIEVLR